MKTKLLALTAFLLVIAFIPGCKKEDSDTFKAKMIGRWQVSKVERTVYRADGTTVESTTTQEYTPADYMDFKNNENDELELNLGSGNRFVGNYIVLLGNEFNISLSDRLLYCKTGTMDDNTFQFTGTVDKSSPKVTETYFLKR